MKKILVTRKLLKSNEDKIVKLWDAKLNLNDKIYSQNELFDKLDDNVLDFSESNPFGEIGNRTS